MNDFLRSLTRPVALAAVVLLVPLEILAAGLFIAPRGVRPLARGGAFVAGAEDVHALVYNPAGLGFASNEAVIDFGVPLHRTDYTRLLADSGERLPTVTGEGLGLPSPTMAAVYSYEPWGLTFGGGLFADYPALQNWPRVLSDGQPAPQRYAIVNYTGTAVVRLSAGVGYQPVEWLSLGLALQGFTGRFVSETTLSNCDGVVCDTPEDPMFDAAIQFESGNFVQPGLHAGLIVTPARWLRLGLSWESGYRIDVGGVLRGRLPDDEIFDEAYLDPAEPKATARFSLPMSVRTGVEFRGDTGWRLEGAFVWEKWSVHDMLELDPEETVIAEVALIGDYRLGRVEIERAFRDTWSIRLGGELPLGDIKSAPLTLRGGILYEPSAIAPEKLTAMVVDLDKVITTVGLGWQLDELRIDILYGLVFMPTQEVAVSDVLQASAARPPWDGRTTIGEGTYESGAHILGLGATLRL